MIDSFENTDVEYYEHEANVQLSAEWSEWFVFGAPLRRLDALNITSDTAITLYIETA